MAEFNAKKEMVEQKWHQLHGSLEIEEESKSVYSQIEFSEAEEWTGIPEDSEAEEVDEMDASDDSYLDSNRNSMMKEEVVTGLGMDWLKGKMRLMKRLKKIEQMGSVEEEPCEDTSDEEEDVENLDAEQIILAVTAQKIPLKLHENSTVHYMTTFSSYKAMEHVKQLFYPTKEHFRALHEFYITIFSGQKVM